MAVLHDRVEQLVAVEERAVAIGHREAVAVAVEGDAEVGLVLAHGAAPAPWAPSRRTPSLMLMPLGWLPIGDDLRAQLLEEAHADAVVGAVRAVDHELQARAA